MFIDSVIYIGLAQSIFAVIALATRFRGKVSDRILIACLITFAIKFVAFSLQEIHGDFLNLEFSTGLIPMTFGPYVYLYTKYLVDRKVRFDWKDLIHFVPFVFLMTLYFAFFKDSLSFSDVAFFNKDAALVIRLFFGITYMGMVVLYTILTFRKLNQHRRSLESQFSYWSQQLKLTWLNFIPFLFTLFFAGYFAAGILNALAFKQVVNITDISHVGLTLMAFLISYFGLRQPSLFQPEFIGSNDMEEQVSEQEQINDRSGNHSSDSDVQEQIESLDRIMIEDKPYLNSVLTLYDLATKVNLNKTELTNLLNKEIGKNFFTYVNEYRVNEVIKRFKNPAYQNYTIIAIAYDCGFNSKSTFNSLFKQHTGQTPSEFRKNFEDSPE
ncbi:MAG: helix-turn-helix transcriptional regulator [Chitinophagales bacterium]